MNILNSAKTFLIDKDIIELKETLNVQISAPAASKIAGNENAILPTDLVRPFDDVILGIDVLLDVEMFNGYRETNDSIYNRLNHSYTHGGRVFLKQLLAHPTSNAKVLGARQACLRSIRQHVGRDTLIPELLNTLKEHESALYWVYDTQKHGNETGLYDIVYFNFLVTKLLNGSDLALTAKNFYKIIGSPLIGIITPISYILVPYLVLVFKMKLRLSFIGYVKMMFQMMFLSNNLFMGSGLMGNIKYISCALTLMFYFQGIFNSGEVSQLAYKVSKIIHNNMYGFVTYVKTAKALDDLLWADDPAYNNSWLSNTPTALFDAPTTVDYFQTVQIDRDFSVFSNFGKPLKLFKSLNFDAYKPIILRSYVMDAVCGVASCLSKHHNNFSLVNIVQNSPTPILELSGVWHPSISQDVAVKNTINFGDNTPVGVVAILTGPNAGGKSTLLKAVLTNVILAQTIGIASATSMRFTPFTFINSQINIPDCKGKESLFEAEMHRSKFNLDQVKTLQPGQHSFIAMDEVFNSTNPVEGIAGAYAMIRHLAQKPSVLTMITTHYLYLTKLSKEFPKQVCNYKMMVDKDATTGAITFPYVMKRGISRQYIALDLLRLSGFDDDIIKVALGVKERLVSKV